MASSYHKYYPYPSSVSAADFVSVKASMEGEGRRNFKNWKKQMVCLLVSQDVMGFVDGEMAAPEEEQQRKVWRRTDMLVQGWILGSVGADVLDAVRDKETARDMWLELHNIFKEKEDPNKDKQDPKKEEEEDRAGGDFSRYVPLYQAALRGDWETAKNFFEDINELSTTIISTDSETALHIAVLTGKANNLVNKLVDIMSLKALSLKDNNGNTALHNAAKVGNRAAVRALVKKCPDLLHTPNGRDGLPVHEAIVFCQKKTVEYLIAEHKSTAEHKSFFEGQRGVQLFIETICSEFVDITLDLAYKYPNLALLTLECTSPLTVIAKTSNLFPRTETFSWWQNFIYQRIPPKKLKFESAPAQDLENNMSGTAAHENYSLSFQIYSRVAQKVELMIWKVIKHLVPKVKMLRDKKTRHAQAVQLVEYLCNQLVRSSKKEASDIFRRSAFDAAKCGISEIVEMIIDNYPSALCFYYNETGENIFHVAAKGRFENVINLINNMSDRRYLFFGTRDINNNNLMHICGEMAPSHRLNLVPGAALQMQRELQWFKKMEDFVQLSRRTWPNRDGRTPQQVFTECHKDLKADGERWMKDTGNACSIAAALIATVMFAAAFTVPGGVQSATGIPLFIGRPAFEVFAVADALSLFTSTTSLLMFLSILTSRHAEEDFLRSLPQRLSMGLLSLFASITFMMVAFSATLFLVFHGDSPWFVALVAVFACLPVTSFVLLQFPLLLDVVILTYGPGIFRKKSRKFLY